MVVSTILDGVYGVGAAPAWSADGQALAFSAMPSDRSTGPDIYVWRVGDGRAAPVTNDHRSYFASWSGTTIVASRTDAVESVLAAPRITTLAINLATREQRTVRGPELWLPQVDPSAQRAVGWHGELGWQDGEVVPVHGALYLVDWASLNPFGDAAPVVSPTIDAVDMSNGYAGTPTMTPAPEASGSPPAPPEASAVPFRFTRAGRSRPADTARPGRDRRATGRGRRRATDTNRAATRPTPARRHRLARDVVVRWPPTGRVGT